METKQFWQRKYKYSTAIGILDCIHIGVLKQNSIMKMSTTLKIIIITLKVINNL